MLLDGFVRLNVASERKVGGVGLFAASKLALEWSFDCHILNVSLLLFSNLFN